MTRLLNYLCIILAAPYKDFTLTADCIYIHVILMGVESKVSIVIFGILPEVFQYMYHHLEIPRKICV